MLNIFSSWRGKMGATLLLLAIFISIFWVRSYYATDTMHILGGDLESTKGSIKRSERVIKQSEHDYRSTYTIHWRVPHWALVLCLTALSIRLLMTSSRYGSLRKATQLAAPTPEKIQPPRKKKR